MPRKRRAIGVVRVSRVSDDARSPDEQLARIRAECERLDLKLIDVVYELDVSGGTPLDRRAGLRSAVERVEAGEADLILVAYFDRLVRSLAVQAEVTERVERAGGQVQAVDVGRITNGTAAQWMSAASLGMAAEYLRRSTGERTEDAKRAAVERGVPPFANIPPGLRRRVDMTGEKPKTIGVEHDPKAAPVVVEAFRLRAGGATVKEVRGYLREHGIERSYHGVLTMLSSRLYLGELRFGEIVNPTAFTPLIDAGVFGRVQRMSLPRGRKSKSERLLARLGVLRCGSCGSRMSVGTANRSTYHLYRCPPVGDCTKRVTISASLVESVVAEEVQKLLAGMRGRATAATGVSDALRDLDRAQQALDAAFRTFTGMEDEQAARERLAELRDARDEAQRRHDELAEAATATLTIDPSADWDLLTLDERRALIRAVVERVTVAPGRGRDRITVEPRG